MHVNHLWETPEYFCVSVSLRFYKQNHLRCIVRLKLSYKSHHSLSKNRVSHAFCKHVHVCWLVFCWVCVLCVCVFTNFTKYTFHVIVVFRVSGSVFVYIISKNAHKNWLNVSKNVPIVWLVSCFFFFVCWYTEGLLRMFWAFLVCVVLFLSC